MNGINMNTFFANAGFFNPKKDKDIDGKQKGMPGTVKIPGKTVSKEEKSGIDKLQDTVDISGKSREIKQAGYSKPAMQVQKDETELPKTLNKDGVQNGVELSDAAKDLLAKLKEKYGNMDFYIANTSSDEEASYYLNQGRKDFSVLIDPETLEAMAADEDTLAKYEEILDGTGEMFDSIKEEIGEENMGKIRSINITFDKDGKTSYIVEMFDEMNKANKAEQQAANKADKNRVTHKKPTDKKDDRKTVRIKADTQEELIQKIKEKLAEQAKAVKPEESAKKADTEVNSEGILNINLDTEE